jgi:hypothetical protein
MHGVSPWSRGKHCPHSTPPSPLPPTDAPPSHFQLRLDTGACASTPTDPQLHPYPLWSHSLTVLYRERQEG